MIPNNVLSVTPIPAPFLSPRTIARASAQQGMSDVHYGGIALGDASHGLTYQLWTCFTDGNNVWLSAPNTPAYIILPGVGAAWVALAMDQNARVFIAYAILLGAASYYWFDSTIPGYRTSTLSGVIPRVFASLDDSRPALLTSSDVILSYVRAGELFFRAQRDRFGIEYDLGAAPANLVQIGMNRADRFQFEFQTGSGVNSLPPIEFLGSH